MKFLEHVESNKTLPPIGKHVLVRCPTFNGLGYLDMDGKWRNACTDEELPEVLDYQYQAEDAHTSLGIPYKDEETGSD